MASADTMLFVFGDGINTGAISAIINALAALAVIYIMQTTTADAGFGCRLSQIKLGHRLTLAFLAVALAINAAVTVTAPEMPRLIDVLLHGALLSVLAFSAWRHLLVRPPDQ